MAATMWRSQAIRLYIIHNSIAFSKVLVVSLDLKKCVYFQGEFYE